MVISTNLFVHLKQQNPNPASDTLWAFCDGMGFGCSADV
jgi:hypothetical protein